MIYAFLATTFLQSSVYTVIHETIFCKLQMNSVYECVLASKHFLLTCFLAFLQGVKSVSISLTATINEFLALLGSQVKVVLLEVIFTGAWVLPKDTDAFELRYTRRYHRTYKKEKIMSLTVLPVIPMVSRKYSILSFVL